MKRVRACKDGFTLLEVMIAMAIIATALVTLLGLSQRSIMVQDRIQKLTRATLLAQQLMNEQETAGQKSASDLSPPKEDVFPEPFEEFRWEISYQDTMIGQVKQVTVRVIWGGKTEKNEDVQLVSFIPVGGSR